MFEAGLIPDSQMTDEEKQRAMQMIQAAQAEAEAGGQMSPVEMAVIEQTQAQTRDTESRIDERLGKLQLQQRKQELDEVKFAQQAQNEQVKLMMQQNEQIVKALNTQAETLKTIKEAMGNVTIVGPGTAEAYSEQSEVVRESQEMQS